MESASATIPVGYKQTEIGVIPEDWEISTLGDISIKITDGTHYTPTYVISGVPFYSVETLTSGDFSKTKFISEEEHQNLIKRCKPEKGDILMTRIGTLGITKRINWDCDASIYVSLCLLKSNGTLDYSYVSEYSKSQLFVKEVFKRSLLGATPKKINMNRIGEIPIAHPSDANECLEIAEVLSNSDSQIQALEKLIAKKRNIKQGTMQELLTGKTRLHGFSGEWELKSIGEIAQVIGGGTPSTQVSHYWGGTINWFTPTEVGSNKYVFESERKLTDSGLQNSSSSLLPIGAILLTSRAGIGDLGILSGRACTNQGFQSMVCNDKVNNEFLYYVMLTKRAELERRSSGSTFLEISPRELKSLLISLPQINEQQAIAAVLSDIDTEIASLEQRLEKTKAIKQGMMQQLLTGRIRLVDPSTPVEASA